jgi:hypothetical protein
MPTLSKISSLLMMASFLILEILLVKAVLYYKKVKSEPSELELMQMNLQGKN